MFNRLLPALIGISVVYGEFTHPVLTSHGPVIGLVQTYDGATVNVYKGVPYAAPPVGDLRFSPPQAQDTWTEPLHTTDYRHRCVFDPEGDYLFFYDTSKAPPMDEDCLHMTIVAPTVSADRKKAVMVYIHGGRLARGSSADFEPEALAIAGDVVTVAINYRLNVFGFLATMDDTVPGNVGFLDQVMALKWIKENVAEFGGDPERITILGESAGGWSVSAHVISPLSKGLFNRAISQSGSLYGSTLETRRQRAEKTVKFAQHLKCPTEDTADMLQCLRAQPARDLYDADVAFGYLPMVCPTYEDDFLPRSPTELFDSRRVHPGIEYMLGVNSEEGAVMLMIPGGGSLNLVKTLREGEDRDGPLMKFTLSALINVFLRVEPQEVAKSLGDIINNFYFKNYADRIGNVRGILDALADYIFIAPTVGTAETVYESGNKVFVYRFDQTPDVETETNIPQYHLPGAAAPGLGYGAIHGWELFYMFAHPLVAEAPMSSVDTMPTEDRYVAMSMVHAWTTFAKTGIPEYLVSDGLSKARIWPEYDNIDEKYLDFKYPMSEKSVNSRLFPQRVDFWNKLIPSYLKDYIAEDLIKSDEIVYRDEL